MKKIIFFPGWPEMFSLLNNFTDELENNYSTKTYGKDKVVIGGKEKLILISYSAEVIPLFEFAFNNLASVERIILIAPAETINREFSAHCLAFLKEIKHFYNFDKKRAKKILKKSVCTFLSHPIKSILKINQIRNFKLEENVKKIKWACIRVDQVYSINDYFIFHCSDLVLLKKTFFTKINFGHFSITCEGKSFAQKIMDLIES